MVLTPAKPANLCGLGLLGGLGAPLLWLWGCGFFGSTASAPLRLCVIKTLKDNVLFSVDAMYCVPTWRRINAYCRGKLLILCGRNVLLPTLFSVFMHRGLNVPLKPCVAWL